MTRTVITALALTLLSAIPSQADSISFDLNCIVGHPTPGEVQCGVPTSYGTVTLDDMNGSGDILLTVDLAGTGEKFKDLFFNYTGTAASITAGSGALNLITPDAHHGPYTGEFDVAAPNGDDEFSIRFYGWNSTSSHFPTSSTNGVDNVNLTLEDFLEKTLNQTFLAVHIVNMGPDGCKAEGPVCTPGSTGGGSMNAVGSNSFSRGGKASETVPEPASLVLFAGGLLFGASRLRRRRT